MKLLLSVFLSLWLVGCGGADGNPGLCSVSEPKYCSVPTAGGSTANSATGSTGATVSTPTSASQSTVCGVVVGSNLLEGIVTDVHDGDTLKLSSAGVVYDIRLDSIDAPELAQPFGRDSQVALEKSVFGKTVKVAYSKTDQYGRFVGAVFNDACQYINLNQVATGMAWFYKAYKCEISSDLRSRFAQAQDSAANAKLGLWSQVDPEAPWFYRNGVEPVTPVCKSDSPTIAVDLSASPVGATTTANSSSVVAPTTSGATSVICYTGPRGGTYTLTASGNKNYGGC